MTFSASSSGLERGMERKMYITPRNLILSIAYYMSNQQVEAVGNKEPDVMGWLSFSLFRVVRKKHRMCKKGKLPSTFPPFRGYQCVYFKLWRSTSRLMKDSKKPIIPMPFSANEGNLSVFIRSSYTATGLWKTHVE